MHPDLLPLLGRPYKFDHAPRIDLPEPEMVNCYLAIHETFRLGQGIKLPLGLWVAEIFADEHFFRTVVKGETLWTYDVALFGPEAENFDPRYLHAASVIDQTSEPELIHANSFDQAVTVWPLSRFYSKLRYARLIRVKRFHYHPLMHTQKLDYVL